MQLLEAEVSVLVNLEGIPHPKQLQLLALGFEMFISKEAAPYTTNLGLPIISIN